MAWTEFKDYRGGFKVDQIVQYWSEGRPGVASRNHYDVLVRVTDTLVTTKGGLRFNKWTGVQAGAKARCERRAQLTRVFAAD